MSEVSIHRVLVVDDDESLLRSWRRRIGRPHSVFTATEPASALALARAHGPDLAIVDMRLGSSSGLDVVREIRRDHPNILIVLGSGYLSVATAVAAVRAGADHVVFKPFTFSEILRLIHQEPEPDLDDTPTLARA